MKHHSQVLDCESSLLDELVADAVQKFEPRGTPAPVTLADEPTVAPVLDGSGGMVGLGPALEQRIAVLHGGSLRPMPSAPGCTTLCLAPPLAT